LAPPHPASVRNSGNSNIAAKGEKILWGHRRTRVFIAVLAHSEIGLKSNRAQSREVHQKAPLSTGAVGGSLPCSNGTYARRISRRMGTADLFLLQVTQKLRPVYESLVRDISTVPTGGTCECVTCRLWRDKILSPFLVMAFIWKTIFSRREGDNQKIQGRAGYQPRS
jgi:hypothetical protein